MCSKCVTNKVFGTIISILFLILLVLVTLIITNFDTFVNPSCKLDDDDNVGVCVNASLCFDNQRSFTDDDCNTFDGFSCCFIENIITESEKKFVQHKNFKFLNTAHCGTSENEEFDYVVDLGFRNERDDVKFSCSGSIISRHFVVTSAQCAIPVEPRLKLSAIRLRNHQNCLKSHDHECTDITDFKVIPHPLFDPINITNDIALIRLSKSVGHKVIPICLPFGIERVPNDMNGITLESDDYESHFVNLPECHARLKSINKFGVQSDVKMKPLYEDSQFCAQTSDSSYICQGDSGAPLQKSTIIRAKNRIIQYGIFSYSMETCGFPGIYTKIHHYLDWILDNVDS